MEKHTNVPAAATWNTDYNVWDLGEQNSEGKNIGIWQSCNAAWLLYPITQQLLIDTPELSY